MSQNPLNIEMIKNENSFLLKDVELRLREQHSPQGAILLDKIRSGWLDALGAFAVAHSAVIMLEDIPDRELDNAVRKVWDIVRKSKKGMKIDQT